MTDLLTRTLSQGLQAFLPVAFALAWFHRAGDRAAMRGLRWGIAAAIPATIAAAYGYQHSTHQSAWAAGLAGVALLAAIWFSRVVRRDQLPETSGPRANARAALAFAAGATIMIVRQTMEIGVGLAAALELRLRDPLIAITGGVVLALAAAIVWTAAGKRLSSPLFRPAVRVFAVLFAAQAAFYAFHKSAESGWLPWQDVLDAATEPYGPDGFYGRYVSYAIFLLPSVGALAARIPRRAPARPRGRPTAKAARSVVLGAIAPIVGLELMSAVKAESADRSAEGAAPARGVAAFAAAPHLLFRHTAVDPNYSRLSIAPLGARTQSDREATRLACERVSFAAGRGLCLTADRGMFTTYKAFLLDASLQATRELTLEGSPSRTRVSPDGRVGALTVFAPGSSYQYEGSSFSTKTIIVDMASGDGLGDLESFTTWRNGARFKAADFNFWGVTFARDSNVFYATLKSAGTTYLARGDLDLRRLTVVRENVECPALSPDNRLIAFKKRVAAAPAPWRFYVLDLTTMAEHPIAGETRSIDDQIEWLDNTQVLYGAPRTDRPSSRDVWVASIDGNSPARIFLPEAESPIVVR